VKYEEEAGAHVIAHREDFLKNIWIEPEGSSRSITFSSAELAQISGLEGTRGLPRSPAAKCHKFAS